MKVLFIGDSITKGRLGAGFVNLTTRHLTNCSYKNLGRDGDTLTVILQRLLDHLKNTPDYDVIVLQGGYNDILLPAFKERGGLFEFAYNHQLKKGQKPLKSTADLYSTLKNVIKELKQIHKGQLIMLTLGCINEKASTKLHEQRIEWNNTIRQLTTEENILLADAGELFDRFLTERTQTDYCIENFWAVTYTDTLISFFKSGVNLLSKKRKLFLTVDGVHLNNLGAAFFSDSIKTLIKENT